MFSSESLMAVHTHTHTHGTNLIDTKRVDFIYSKIAVNRLLFSKLKNNIKKNILVFVK